MAVIKIKGDLLDFARKGHFDIVMHGANCQSTMNSGIAKQIKAQFPEAYYVDVDDRRKPEDKLGCYSIAYIESYNFTLINAYTQLNFNWPGEPFHDRFEYEAFEKILRTLAKYHPNHRYGFPYIGMGLAGGNKERILAMLEYFSNQITGTVTLVEYEN